MISDGEKLTEPEFSIDASKTLPVVLPFAIKVHGAVLSSLNHLKSLNR